MNTIDTEPNEDRMGQEISDSDRALLMATFAQMDGVAMTIAMAALFGLSLFAATALLLIKGAPPGVPVGPNLSSLGSYLPGYTVSWAGSIVGALYASLVGGVIGGFFAILWNFAHIIYAGITAIHGQWLE